LDQGLVEPWQPQLTALAPADQGIQQQIQVMAAGGHPGNGEGIARQSPLPLRPGQVEIIDRGHHEPQTEGRGKSLQHPAKAALTSPHRTIEGQQR